MADFQCFAGVCWWCLPRLGTGWMSLRVFQVPMNGTNQIGKVKWRTRDILLFTRVFNALISVYVLLKNSNGTRRRRSRVRERLDDDHDIRAPLWSFGFLSCRAAFNKISLSSPPPTPSIVSSHLTLPATNSSSIYKNVAVIFKEEASPNPLSVVLDLELKNSLFILPAVCG